MGRGNHRQDIFKDKEDYQFFIALLADVQKKYPYLIHSYCLMTNHYHFLLETKEKEIWLIMKRILQIYVEYYNRKYGLIGRLFQDRYRSCVIHEDSYFLQTSRYIHLNPVKAGMIAKPEDYPWSSYRTIIGMNRESFVTEEKILSYFKEPKNLAYRTFVEDTTMFKQELVIQKMMKEDDLWLPW